MWTAQPFVDIYETLKTKAKTHQNIIKIRKTLAYNKTLKTVVCLQEKIVIIIFSDQHRLPKKQKKQTELISKGRKNFLPRYLTLEN